MKSKIQQIFGKRMMMGMLAFLFIVGTMCLVNVDGSRVLASNTVTPIELAEGTDYKVEKHSDIGAFRENGVLTAPELSDTTIADKWIFAGWYQDQECKKALSDSSVETGEYYAKFVSVDVLSVKCQISADTTSESDGTLIRCISSVDSLKYNQIGFEFVTPNGTLYMQSKKVGTRINAINAGNDCSYSPKVVDTESEYFFSAVYSMTKKDADAESGIVKEDFDTTYIVKPYWVTSDGTTVYGMSRCISVNEALTKQVIYIPVKMDEAPTDNHTLTANGTTLAYVDYDTDSQYAHFALSINTSLASATKYDIAGSDGNGNSVSTNYIYRNLGTKYRGEAKTNIDASFYEIYNEADTSEDEYVIITSMDLYGLRKSVNASSSPAFVGKTFYVVCDIEVNKGKATSTSWDKTHAVDGTEIDDGTEYPWTRIGADNIQFGGTFDGQGHTISGIYYQGASDTRGQGLFGATANTATIKNFSLTNSYFTAQNNFLGSIVGKPYGGTFESIFSDAIINVNRLNVGGLIGRNEKAVTMKNCWFAGQLTNTQTHTGGLIGHVYADATIMNCLNTGQIKAKATVGGFFGNVKNVTVTLSHCLNNGKVTSTDGDNFGAIAGNIETTDSIDCDYIYVEKASCGHIVNGSNESEEVAKVEDVTVVEKSTVTGVKALTTDTKSLFSYVIDEETYANESYWAISPNGAPVLASFADVANAMPVDTSWYNSSKSEFTLSDAADLYGLALLSKTDNFEKKTLKLGADITINEGTPDEWTAETTLHNWLPIGYKDSSDANKDIRFAGTFDGQMHSINGMYLDATVSNVGMFATTNFYSTIKNLKLMNSSFKTTKGAIGSVAGYGYGTFDTIYSDAYVEGGSFWIGGMIGETHSGSTMTMNNCWFDGEVVQSGAGNATQKASVGGLLGLANNTVTIKNCLNTGSVTVAYNASTDPYVGGLVGRAVTESKPEERIEKKLTIQHCLNTGEVSFASMSTTGFGSIVGGVDDSTDGQNVIVENSYATSQSCWEIVGTNNKWSKFDVTVVDGNTIGGDNAKDEDKLGGLFDETLTTKWVVSAKHPVLEAFEKYAPTEKNVTALHQWVTSSASLTATLQNPVTLPNPEGVALTELSRQGGYTEGDYFYQAYITYKNKDNEAENKVKVLKYDLKNKNAVVWSAEMPLTHANDITYNSKMERLVVCHAKPNANKVSYIAIADGELVLVEEPVELGFNIYNIDYNEAKDVYVAQGDGNKFYVLNSNFEIISDAFPLAEVSTQHTGQGVSCDDDYIYFVLSAGTVKTEVIAVYDWSGTLVTTITLNIDTESDIIESENISVVGDQIYIMVAELVGSTENQTEKPANVYIIDKSVTE